MRRCLFLGLVFACVPAAACQDAGGLSTRTDLGADVREPAVKLDSGPPGGALDADAPHDDALVIGDDDAGPLGYPDAAHLDAALPPPPPPPPPPPDECASYPFSATALLDERVGFGRNALGGDPANVYHVTTLNDLGSGSLRAALESTEHYWIVFDVEGEIVLDERAEILSYKTIDGRGRDITVRGTMTVQDAEHVIISDIKVTNPDDGHCTQSGDVLVIRGAGDEDPALYTSKNVWIHHVEAFNGGDGLLDIRGGTFITVSWSKFHTHKKGMLMWKNQDNLPAPGMRVTMHHNYFDKITLRGPQFFYGWAHFFNNYQYRWYEYGAGSFHEAQFASENNVYEARPGTLCIPSCPDPNPCGDTDLVVSKKGLIFDWSENGIGYVKSTGDLALEGAELDENEPHRVFDPLSEYPYLADPADATLATTVMTESGPRTGYCRN